MIAREGNRYNLGIGFRFAIIEEKITSAEAISRNGRIWKENHVISPASAMTSEAREMSE